MFFASMSVCESANLQSCIVRHAFVRLYLCVCVCGGVCVGAPNTSLSDNDVYLMHSRCKKLFANVLQARNKLIYKYLAIFIFAHYAPFPTLFSLHTQAYILSYIHSQ